MASQTTYQVHLRIPQAANVVHASAREALDTLFQQEVVPDAKRLSPVSEANPSLLEARGLKRRDTGHNRRTIDSVVVDTPEGPKALIFTQSGYGGWLEIGTSKMPARPYIFPAVQLNAAKYPVEVAARLKVLAGDASFLTRS